MRKNGTVYFLTQDHLGGTALVTQAGDPPKFVSRVRYYPYGLIRTQEGTLPTDKLFTGQQRETTAIYHYGARFYNADIGRFISADSIVPEPGNPQALNRYSYVLNNPVRYTDPTGYCIPEINCPPGLGGGTEPPSLPESPPVQTVPTPPPSPPPTPAPQTPSCGQAPSAPSLCPTPVPDDPFESPWISVEALLVCEGGFCIGSDNSTVQCEVGFLSYSCHTDTPIRFWIQINGYEYYDDSGPKIDVGVSVCANLPSSASGCVQYTDSVLRGADATVLIGRAEVASFEELERGYPICGSQSSCNQGATFGNTFTLPALGVTDVNLRFWIVDKVPGGVGAVPVYYNLTNNHVQFE